VRRLVNGMLYVDVVGDRPIERGEIIQTLAHELTPKSTGHLPCSFSFVHLFREVRYPLIHNGRMTCLGEMHQKFDFLIRGRVRGRNWLRVSDARWQVAFHYI
jgi:hypothetical protein